MTSATGAPSRFNQGKTALQKSIKYFRRLIHVRQMDFEFGSWQMLHLLIAPQKVYRNFQYRKQTKDQFARDDPAFLVLLAGLLCVTSCCFGFVLGLSLPDTLKLLTWIVVIDCIGSGLLIATGLWWFSNRYSVDENTLKKQTNNFLFFFQYFCSTCFPSQNSFNKRRRMGLRFRRSLKLVCSSSDSTAWSPADFRLNHQANLVSIDFSRKHFLAGFVELLLLHHFSGILCLELSKKNHDFFDADGADSIDLFVQFDGWMEFH